MPVTVGNQDRPDARERVGSIVTGVIRHPPKAITDMARKDVQVEVAQVIERATILQKGYAIAAQLVLEQLCHVPCCFGDVGEQVFR